MTTRAWKIEAACSVNCWSLPISFSRAYARATLRASSSSWSSFASISSASSDGTTIR